MKFKPFTILSVILLSLSSLLYADDKPSYGEIQLFETDHLENITKPSVLHYTFVKSGSFEKGFTSSVDLLIEKVNADNSKDVSVSFLTGKDRVGFPAVTGAKGNPIILYFLERDLVQMQRLTGGQPHYFKKRIRLALLTVTQSQPAVFIYGGKEVQGQQIEFTPYVNDPLKPRFGKLDVKRYIFILSADVPGYVYQIRTVAPDTDPNNTLIEEVLTLDSVTGKK